MNEELIDIRKEELKGAYIRSRAEWLEFGEKPSRFFSNLENRNRVNKNISEIVTEQKTITKQSEILEEVKNFYDQLYKQNDQPRELIDNTHNPIPTILTESEKEKLDLPITKSEIDDSLLQLKNNKTPGLDGYSAEFFKKFWAQLGNSFLACINECFQNNCLTQSQTQGLITCLPKSGKARNLLKNWRPISLLNTSYKLISLCITNRIRPILDCIISTEQKGFLSGRSISDCTRMMYDTIFECESKKINGLILLVDLEKAFDSLSWKFINESLQKFNFGPNIIKWIKKIQKGSNSRVILNGHLSESFELQRGCRQGDPISPYIFILCSEFLTLAIKDDVQLKGIEIRSGNVANMLMTHQYF